MRLFHIYVIQLDSIVTFYIPFWDPPTFQMIKNIFASFKVVSLCYKALLSFDIRGIIQNTLIALTHPLYFTSSTFPHPWNPKFIAYLFCQTWLGYWEAVYLFIHPHRRTVHICNYRNISVFHYGELLKPYCSVKWCMVYVQPTPLRDIWDYICNPQGNGSILIF